MVDFTICLTELGVFRPLTMPNCLIIPDKPYSVEIMEFSPAFFNCWDLALSTSLINDLTAFKRIQKSPIALNTRFSNKLTAVATFLLHLKTFLSLKLVFSRIPTWLKNAARAAIRARHNSAKMPWLRFESSVVETSLLTTQTF